MERDDLKEIRGYFPHLDDVLAVIGKLGAHVYDRSPQVLPYWDDDSNDWGAAFDAAMAVVTEMRRATVKRESGFGLGTVSPTRRNDMLVRAYGAARRALQSGGD